MRKPAGAAALTLVFGLLAGVPPPANATAVLVASRCNSQTIDDSSAQVRDYDRHGPGRSTDQQLQRYGALASVIAVLNEEREILASLCASDVERSPLFAQIAATGAWALALQSDVAARLNSSCPAAAKGLPTIMLADAWLTLATVVNERNGAVPPQLTDVIPKVQTRAQAIGLDLPAWNETSAYWRDQVREKAQAEIATCPSPSPSASPALRRSSS